MLYYKLSNQQQEKLIDLVQVANEKVLAVSGYYNSLGVQQLPMDLVFEKKDRQNWFLENKPFSDDLEQFTDVYDYHKYITKLEKINKQPTVLEYENQYNKYKKDYYNKLLKEFGSLETVDNSLDSMHSIQIEFFNQIFKNKVFTLHSQYSNDSEPRQISAYDINHLFKESVELALEKY